MSEATSLYEGAQEAALSESCLRTKLVALYWKMTDAEPLKGEMVKPTLQMKKKMRDQMDELTHYKETEPDSNAVVRIVRSLEVTLIWVILKEN